MFPHFLWPPWVAWLVGEDGPLRTAGRLWRRRFGDAQAIASLGNGRDHLPLGLHPWRFLRVVALRWRCSHFNKGSLPR